MSRELRFTLFGRFVVAILALSGALTVSADPQLSEVVDLGYGQYATIRAVRPSAASSITPPLAPQYAALATAARAGNAAVAESLYAALSLCRTAYRTEEALTAAANTLRIRRLLFLPGKSEPTPIPPDADVELLVRTHLEIPFRMCAGLSDEQIAAADQWLLLAARNGSAPAAAEALARNLDADRRREFEDVLWRAGEASVLGAWAKQAAAEADADPGRRDRLVEAFAYQLALVHIGRFSARIQPPGPARTRYFRELENGVLQLERLLTPEERRVAAARAGEIIGGSPNCCIPL